MQTLVSVIDNPIMKLFLAVFTLGSFVVFASAFVLAIRGIIPVLYRLGRALAGRRIAIFAEDEFVDLRDMLIDSGLFQEKNILQISKSSIHRAEKATLFVVHYASFQNQLDEILAAKRDRDALVVYAPKSDGDIDLPVLNKLNSHRNTVIVNFRGRLLNDILTSSITSGF